MRQDKAQELSLEQINYIFRDYTIKRNLEVINITGGEPTLRPDLPDLIRLILDNSPKLKRIDLSTNGIDTARVIDQIERILALILPTPAKLSVNISLDGVGKTHEDVRGRAGIFASLDKTIDELRRLSSIYRILSLGLNMTISRLNYKAIEETLKYATEKGLGLNFTLAALSEIGVKSLELDQGFQLDGAQSKELILTFEKLMRNRMVNQKNGAFILSWLKRGRRNQGCIFKRQEAFLLEPDGRAYLCGNYQDFLIGNLAKEPFYPVWKQAVFRSRSIKNRCAGCLSNCYL
jgi:MoaA/NifB/PqqE/SkfB family radical SAM enzyme